MTTRLLAALLGAVLWSSTAFAQTVPSIPITFTLPDAGYVTVVIEDQDGRRVRNLIQETFLASGPQTVFWDGYDEGVPAERSRPEGSYVIERSLVAPDTFVVRALYHEGVSLAYEFSVQSPGETPWHTGNKAGAWFSDHQSAYDVAWLPAGTVQGTAAPVLFFTARKGEAGHAFMQLEEDGTKVIGETELPGDAFLGGHNLAYDAGLNRDTTIVVYIAAIDSLTLNLYRWNQFADAISDPPLSYPLLVEDTESVKGLAAYNQVVAVSLPFEDKIVFLDEANGVVVNEVSVPSPRGLHVTDTQQLYVASGNQVLRFDADFATGTLTNETLIVATGLTDPQGLTADATTLFVADWGTSHQVRAYDLSGTLLRILGTAGGPQIGLYDDTRMAYPRGLALDGNGMLWVAERHLTPKRISRWDATTGAFDRAWYGPPKYGGGGTLDPTDRTRLYYAQGGKGAEMRSYEFALDWTTGEATVSRILLDYMHFPTGDLIPFRAPEAVRYAAGRQYLVNNNQEAPSGNRLVNVWLHEGDRLWPVAAAGIVDAWTAIANLNEWPAFHSDQRKVFFVWSDLDRDGIVEVGEVQYRAQDKFQGTLFIEPDLSATSIWGYKVAAPTIQANGVPLYDINTWTTVAPADTVGDDNDSYHLSSDSLFVSFIGPMMMYNNGDAVATYHVQWPNRNISEDEVPQEQYSGQLMETTRPLGDFVVPDAGDAGPLWGVNGDWGQAWLLTWDGYFITKLLEDSRTHPLWGFAPGVIQRGDPIEGVTGNLEQFWPTLNQTSDGQIYYLAGKEHTSILRVDGLETIQRLNLGDLVVTLADLGDADTTLTDGDDPVVQFTAPADAAYYVTPATVSITLEATDIDGTIAQVELFEDENLLATLTAEPYSFTWATPPAGTHVLTATATDDEGNTGTAPPISIRLNDLPSVSLTSPADGALFVAPADLLLAADALDANGSITDVSFYIDGTLFAQDAAAPYEALWSQVGAGTFTLTAEATDDEGETVTSAPVVITVNNAPTAAIITPPDSTVFAAPADVNITVDADDISGTIASVALFAGTELLTTLTAEPFSFTWTGVASGTYALTAVATDNLGTSTTSDTISIFASTPPTVTLTGPADGTLLQGPTDVTVTASAVDPDGTIEKVAFFRDGTLLGEDTTAPYSFLWAEAPTGIHTLFAIATDDLGITAVSDTASIEINALPTASITTPADSAVVDTPATLTIRVTASDADGTVANVSFFADGTLLATDTSTPFEFEWVGVAAGTYLITAEATDDDGGTSPPDSATLFVNALPTIALTAPADGAVITAPADVIIDAEATDIDGTVTSVTFQANGFVLGEDTTAPFSFTWANASAGTFSLTAIASDDRGSMTTSAPISITLNGGPTASLAAPADSSTFAEPADILIGAFASDEDGAVTAVTFFADGTPINTDTAAPFMFTWPGIGAGTYTLYAEATDDLGATTRTDTVTVFVNAPPTATLTAPLDGAVFNAPANITFDVAATDSDGAVVLVEFFRGTFKVGEDAVPPFSFAWTNVPAGVHPLFARATDDRGATATTDTATVTVNTLPDVILNRPRDGASIPPGLNVPLQARARDLDGSVVLVEFFEGANKLGEDATQPYAFTWNSVPTGTYTLTAVATDNLGAQRTSTAITLEVRASLTQSIPLRAGWNLVSSYLSLDPDDVATALSAGTVQHLADTPAALQPTALAKQSAAPWSSGQARWLWVPAADTLYLAGEPLPADQSALALRRGWNTVPYLHPDPMPPAAAFENLGEAVVLVKDAYGRVWAPAVQLDALPSLAPGQGYRAFMARPDTLRYPEPPPIDDANLRPDASGTRADSLLAPAHASFSTGQDATWLLLAPTDLDGHRVVVETAGGLIVGEATVTAGKALVVVLGDDPATPAVQEGARPGEALLLSVAAPGEASALAPLLIRNVTDLLRATVVQTAPLAFASDVLWQFDVAERPTAYSLSPNYPNPFNPTTTIRYALPEPTEVTLEVVDVLGRRVALLVTGAQPAGFHEAVWDAQHVASGLYLYRLQAGPFVQTRRMLLIR